MPRTRGTQVENNVSKGLITEFGALSFPENALFDCSNVVLNKDGSVQRRQGIDFEDTNSQTLPRNNSVIVTYLWETVAGDGDLTFVVVQVHNKVYFYSLPASGALSANLKSFNYTLIPIDVSVTVGNHQCQFTSGNGKLYVFHQYCDPVVIVYDPVGDSITPDTINILTRDFEGVDDTLGLETRPATLTDLHEYNLYNQGWYHTASNDGPGNPKYANAIDAWRGLHDGSAPGPTGKKPDDYPSNSDVWWAYKTSQEYMGLDNLFNKDLGNTPAPKGHFILNEFDTNRSGAHADIGTVPERDSGFFRPRTGAFFSGRVWYAGVDAEGYLNKIYFSQIIQRDAQTGHCFQLNDPTAETQFDLLASDGGEVQILDAGSIQKLVPVQEFLLAFANNGIWAISGSQGIGFKANDYSVRKLSGVGVRNPESIVVADGIPMWWNLDGIWVAEPTQFGTMIVKSMTAQSIQTFYDEITPYNKGKAKGAYDSVNKIVQWLYRSDTPAGLEEAYSFDSVLCFNAILGAFYTYRVDPPTTRDSGIALSGTFGPELNGIIGIQNSLSATNRNRFYYLASTFTGSGHNYKLAFAQETDTNYVDWATATSAGAGGVLDSKDYSSFFTTGYKLYGQGNKDFQDNFISVFMDNQSEDSSLFVRGFWDFSLTDIVSTRRSTAQQCYRLDDDYDTIVSRLKVRGHGKSLQLKFTSESGKPFYWLGWAIEVSGNTTP